MRQVDNERVSATNWNTSKHRINIHQQVNKPAHICCSFIYGSTIYTQYIYLYIYRLYIGKEFYKLTKSFSASLTFLCFICKLPVARPNTDILAKKVKLSTAPLCACVCDRNISEVECTAERPYTWLTGGLKKPADAWTDCLDCLLLGLK